jgi:dynactin complex subunit
MDDISQRLKNQPPYADDQKEEQPQEEPQEEQPQEETPENPQEQPVDQAVSERTKEQFTKLTHSNSTLKEQNDQLNEEVERLRQEALSYQSNGFMPQYPEPVPPPQPIPPIQYPWLVNTPPSPAQYPDLSKKQINDVFSNLQDENGYVNIDAVKEALKEAQDTAKRAQQEAERARRESQEQKKTFDDFQRNSTAKLVHSEYPELDANNKDDFNPTFYEAVRNEMLNQLVHTGQEDFMAAAKKWAPHYAKKEKSKQQEALKQINATQPVAASQRDSKAVDDDLIMRVRRGQKGALEERLKRAGF